MADDQLSLRLTDGRAASDRGGDLDEEAVVRASLDGALEDRLRAAVANPSATVAESCARIEDVFAHRMAAHRHRAWALAEAEVLRRRLKDGLRARREVGQ